VTGSCGLRDIQYGNDVADAQFSPLKQIENPQPSSVGECPKNGFGLRLSRLGLHIRLSKYIGLPGAGQEGIYRRSEIGLKFRDDGDYAGWHGNHPIRPAPSIFRSHLSSVLAGRTSPAARIVVVRAATSVVPATTLAIVLGDWRHGSTRLSDGDADFFQFPRYTFNHVRR
jgi:hypothetical protein